jgi:hypothetical protein
LRAVPKGIPIRERWRDTRERNTNAGSARCSQVFGHDGGSPQPPCIAIILIVDENNAVDGENNHPRCERTNEGQISRPILIASRRLATNAIDTTGSSIEH